MKVAVIGSRSIGNFDLAEFLPKDTTEIVSGGARGVDRIARAYALKNDIPLKEFLPKYELYPGNVAPLMRNIEIIDYADLVLAFWDGKSRGTAHVIKNCQDKGKEVRIYIQNK